MLLPDAVTGEDREVDIGITFEPSGFELCIGIECAARTRRVGVTWVEQMLKKHEHLPVHKTILVSKSGFTGGALEKARFGKAVAISLAEAENFDWLDLLGSLDSLVLGFFKFSILNGVVDYDPNELEGDKLVITPTSLVKREFLKEPITLNEFALQVVGDKRLGQGVMRDWIKTKLRPKEFRLSAHARPHDCTEVQNHDGRWCPLKAIHVVATATVRTSPVDLEQQFYRDLEVAFGTAENIFVEPSVMDQQVLLALVMNEAKLQGSLMIPGHEGKGRAFVPLEFAEDRNNKS
jgi:hypothetical protein